MTAALWTEPQFWLSIINICGTITLGFYTRRIDRDRVKAAQMHLTDRRLTENEKILAKQKEKIARIEERLENLPTHENIGKVYERINAVHGAVEKLTGVISGIKSSLEMIHEYLLKERK